VPLSGMKICSDSVSEVHTHCPKTLRLSESCLDVLPSTRIVKFRPDLAFTSGLKILKVEWILVVELISSAPSLCFSSKFRTLLCHIL
jgi:hypothetical protein